MQTLPREKQELFHIHTARQTNSVYTFLKVQYSNLESALVCPHLLREKVMELNLYKHSTELKRFRVEDPKGVMCRAGCPARGGTAFLEFLCHERVYLVCDSVWGGWCVSSGIHMNARTQVFQAEHCIAMK